MQSLINYPKLFCCCLIAIVGIYSWQGSTALADRFSTGEAAPTIVATPIEMKISLGNTANELKFFPDRVQLVAGKKYKLLLSNSRKYCAIEL